jgi:hypothetical protein
MFVDGITIALDVVLSSHFSFAPYNEWATDYLVTMTLCSVLYGMMFCGSSVYLIPCFLTISVYIARSHTLTTLVYWLGVTQE